MHLGRLLELTLRREGARLRAGLIRRAGDFDRAEDALQEACLRALARWSVDGLPDNPAAWLTTVAQRVLEDARRRREVPLPDDLDVPAVEPCVEEDNPSGIADDRLRLLFTCCHPALAVEAQMALALRTLGGLGTREIARAFLIGEEAVAQRLVRAKAKIRAARIPYQVPAAEALPERLAGVLGTVYLIFNEGYAATAHEGLLRPDLCREAIRLAQLCAELLPDEAEVLGLLALLRLTDARRPARLSASGELVPLP
jgi:RNA polymerase sigma-70 factor, ECF subfamily